MKLLEIKNYLVSKGITSNILIGSIVDGDGVGLFSTSGYSPLFYFDNLVGRLGLQIISRHSSYIEGEKVINDIFILLNELEGFKAEQIPFYIGKDEKNRSEFSVNFTIIKEVKNI